ncbi:hypothetical protein [Mycobacteroides abscessus]|uniref:hypothetical protein n=1 Tax=Mycobacteroides abscessus TaxID=36809 RepID=UPI001300126F|nr:hypothetical protein [Mycobacteroides abscessus]
MIEFGMQPVWSSVVAVVGTLCGVALTYWFAQRTAKKANRVASLEQRRKEFADAAAAFAATAGELSRIEFNRARTRLEHPGTPAHQQARQETYRMRAEIRNARHLLRLLQAPAGDRDVIDSADKVIALLQRISSTPVSVADIHDREQEATAALEVFLHNAARRLADDA